MESMGEKLEEEDGHNLSLWAPLLEKGCCWPVEGDDEESGGCCCVWLPLEDG